MYNPSRGGVRGGADQFTWESVKSDKHRENYLGHSLKAPVGRWQKGKDLSWYSKERKDSEEQNQSNKSEMAAIKRAEEEAMLIALGHNIVKKETEPLTKEEIKDVLKRNIGERDDHNIERIDGVGAGRRALLGGASSKLSNEGVVFESTRKRKGELTDSQGETSPVKRAKNKKKSKKHKHKKKSKHNSEYSDSDDEEKKWHKKSKSKYDKSPKITKKKKKSEYRHRSNSSDSENGYRRQNKNKR